MSKQKKFILQESEIPTQWYNIQADMKHKPLPMLNTATKKPMTDDELSPVFAREWCKQELHNTHADTKNQPLQMLNTATKKPTTVA